MVVAADAAPNHRFECDSEHTHVERDLHLTLMNQRFGMRWFLKELASGSPCVLT
jgi:hypothetical protein